MNSRLSFRAFFATAVGVVIFVIGRYIVLPGVDAEPIRQAFNTGFVPDWFRIGYPIASLFGVGVGWLLVAWLVGGLRTADGSETESSTPGPLRARALFGSYLLACAATSFFYAIHLEAGPGGVMLVEDPGLKFRLIVVLTQTAAAAVLWAVAGWITRRGIGNGALILFGIDELVFGLNRMFSSANDVAQGWAEPTSAALTLLPALSVALCLFCLGTRKVQWPATVVGNVYLLSVFDLLIAPFVATRGLTIAMRLAPPSQRLPDIAALLYEIGLIDPGRHRNFPAPSWPRPIQLTEIPY